MKIGILTHHTVVNFGAFWQAYALQEAVKKICPDADVKIINYIDIKHFCLNLAGWFASPGNRRKIKNWTNTYALPFTLCAERKKYMATTNLCFTAQGINNMNFDAIIVGSDEVWNYDDWKTSNRLKFGVGLNCCNLISYAPSMANSNLDNIPEYVYEGIAKFRHISARDKMTAELARKVTGNEAVMVLDPTFLGKIQTEQNTYLPSQDYILFYYCQNMPETVLEQIKEYAYSHNMKILGAGDNTYEFGQCTVNMTPFQWAEMFRHAKYVFTGTFHGAVFSILNRVPFKVYLTNPGRVAKVGSLLDFLHIDDRLIPESYVFDYQCEKDEIDYDAVYEIIEKERKRSIDFLKNALV